MKSLPPSARLKLELMFEGVRYSDALGEAASHAFPNFYPYRFQPGEVNPTGHSKVSIPYLMSLADGSLIRVKGNGASSWQVTGSHQSGYALVKDANPDNSPDNSDVIEFDPLPDWMHQQTADGFPMAQAGVSLHGDMAVINIAPGCDYFLQKSEDGRSMRCSFCAYGAPNERVAHYSQVIGEPGLPELTYRRMQETLQLALAERQINHIYLVAGSLTDWHDEGNRFIEIARAVQQVNPQRIPVTCGSGALPLDILQQLHAENLVDCVCFNLEVWSRDLFEKVCPGKNRFVGYDRWIASLENAVSLWGRGRVYSAMVAGIEMEPEYDMSWEQACARAIEGAADLCSKGIIPIYSLYWPTGGRDHPDYFSRLQSYFERLNLEYRDIRRQQDLNIWPGFMCHHCAYMQLECDVDRVASAWESAG
jgi:hypothetical protein